MELDSDFLEVTVEENEFDNCVLDATRYQCEEDQEMEALAEETSAKLGIECIGDKEDLRQKIKRGKDKEGVMDDDGERRERRRKRGSNGRRHREHGRNHRDSRLYKALDASPDLDPKILGRELAYRLGENKVGLIVNVVRVLGLKCAMQILEDTRKIERNGGMLTADGARRRAPGGVYICCLKERGYATKKEIDRIFKDEKERMKDKTKRKRQEQAAKRRQEDEKLSKLRKRVIEYVNRKLEAEGEKETGEISEEGEEMMNNEEEKILVEEPSVSGNISDRAVP